MENMNEYELIGIDQDESFLSYKKTAMVHGNLEYGILYDSESEEEYNVQVDHKKMTIRVLDEKENHTF